MERRNKKLIVIVSCLLLVISVSLAYYIGQILINGEGAKGSVKTAKIKGATLTVEGKLEFNDPDILPGHKTISSIKVTATGNNELIPYNLVWKGTNGISQINYTVYKTSSDINVSTSCEKKTSVQNGVQILNEECEVENIDNLGTSISSGSITKNSTKEILASDEFITASPTGLAMYYYVILEYPNLDEDQSADINATFNGEVTVEESNASPDINIIAVYIGDETGNYTETTDIPQSGYALNVNKSTCSNNAVPIWDYEHNGIIASNLTKSGTSCYLYFDKPKNASSLFAAIKKSDARSGEITADTEMDDTKLYSVSDGMYGGTSYVYAGQNPNNYVYFAGVYWRIVRINGDGTIRLIYNGISPIQKGMSTILIDSIFNADGNSSPDNAYVGYMYGTLGSSTYEDTHANINDSSIKKVLDKWYQNNISNDSSLVEKIAPNALYCNDRAIDSTTHSGYPGNGIGSAASAYAPWGRLRNNGWASIQRPSLSCLNSNDIFSTNISSIGNKSLTYPIGLITSDEIVLSGGLGGIERDFWLNCGADYWTMSPQYFSGSASLFFLFSNGTLGYNYSFHNYGVRPVINLKSDVKFTGLGTSESPYVVV